MQDELRLINSTFNHSINLSGNISLTLETISVAFNVFSFLFFRTMLSRLFLFLILDPTKQNPQLKTFTIMVNEHFINQNIFFSFPFFFQLLKTPN